MIEDRIDKLDSITVINTIILGIVKNRFTQLVMKFGRRILRHVF